MNPLDVVVLVLGLGAGIGGWRLGLLARALSWAGLVVGLVLAARSLPWVVERFDGPGQSGRLLVAAGLLVAGALLGQAVGLVVGSRAALALPAAGRPLDRALGAVAGGLGVLAGLWLLLPTLAELPGGVSRATRTSTVARALDRVAPDAPDPLQALRRLVGDTDFPRVFERLRPAPDFGVPPDDTGLAADVLARAAAATVLVEVPACARLQQGSGFVVEPELVVTNAHVVAGGEAVEVVDADGGRAAAVVVAFDPARDLALLSTAELGRSPLPLAAASGTGTAGGVFGHPGGGGLEVSAFSVREEVEAVGRDLYDRAETRRSVLVLASDLEPGDSGGALVDASGAVAGVAFAIAPDQPGTAYALALSELRAVLDGRRSEVSTGPCL